MRIVCNSVVVLTCCRRSTANLIETKSTNAFKNISQHLETLKRTMKRKEKKSYFKKKYYIALFVTINRNSVFNMISFGNETFVQNTVVFVCLKCDEKVFKISRCTISSDIQDAHLYFITLFFFFANPIE